MLEEERRLGKGFRREQPIKTSIKCGVDRDKNKIILSLPQPMKHLSLSAEEADSLIEMLEKGKETLR